MKSGLFTLALGLSMLMPGSARSALTAAPPPPAVLLWNNGEVTAGEPVEATASTLSWKSPLFEQPLALSWLAICRFDIPRAAGSSAEPFDFILRDGSFLHGDLVGIDTDSVFLRSSRHGDVSLQRAQVLAIRRAHGAGLLADGPQGDAGWVAKAQNEGAKSSEESVALLPSGIETAPGGALTVPYWTSAWLDIKLPDLVEIDFRIHSSARPNFEFALKSAKSGKPTLSVETWSEDLVLTVGDEFMFVRKIAADEQDVDLRLFCDAKERKCAAYLPSGELLAAWDLPAGAELPFGGLALRGKGQDLTLESLRIRPWNGSTPARLDRRKPRVELADGSIVEGSVIAAADGVITQFAEGGAPPASIRFSDIDELVLSCDPVRPAPSETVLRYADGTLLMGRLDWLANGWVELTTSFTAAPLVSALDGLRQLHRAPLPASAPKQTLEGLDQLSLRKSTLHGRLTCDGSRTPAWLAVGATKPVTLVKDLPVEIARAPSAHAESEDGAALFFTAAGDVLPGKLVAVDRSGVEFESSITQETKLSAVGLDAIQFSRSTQKDVIGFNDPGWRIVKGNKESVRQSGDSLELDPATSFGHPMIMHAGEIKFRSAAAGLGYIRLRMFCSGVDPAGSSNLLLGTEDLNYFFSGFEGPNGAFSQQSQTPISSDLPIEFDLVIDEQQVELRLNGVSVLTLQIPSEKRAGAGLVIESAIQRGETGLPVALSGFSTASPPARTWTPEVDPSAKTQALTVPRFRREAPPRQALLAANGDVLRGEIVAVTRTHLGFRSGLEMIQIPCERVKTVLWLKQPLAEVSPPEKKRPELAVLDNTAPQLSLENVSLSSVVGAIQQRVAGLKFKLPGRVPVRTFSIQFSGKKLSELLDKICSVAKLRYHVDPTGVIAFESAGPPAGFVETTYWLKKRSIPEAPLVAKILEGKGIPFPTGSAATWNSEAAQLVVVNSPENQSKIASLLESDYGGVADPPTHWFLLTSGARIALAVDRFTEDSVSGRHPLYGAFHIPLSEIYTIRTAAPEPNETMRALRDWRLTFAPEPVTFGEGADVAADLGQDAKPFKLPLLEGGEFDLTKQKGKVVVLDFWATWCGPCVKALPALIEALSPFPAEQVALIGVNQSEPADEVKKFLELRRWNLTVGLDAGPKVGELYNAEGLPRTVVIAPDGKIAWVTVGYDPDGAAEIATVVKKLLAELPPAKASTAH